MALAAIEPVGFCVVRELGIFRCFRNRSWFASLTPNSLTGSWIEFAERENSNEQNDDGAPDIRFRLFHFAVGVD